MKIKIGLLILFIFIVSGCRAEYNLVISNDGFMETTTITTNINDREVYDGSYLSDIFLTEMNLDIPVSFRDVNEYTGQRANTYEARRIRNGNIVGIELKNNFRLEEIYLSNVIKNCYVGFSLDRNEHVYTIRTDRTARCFRDFNLLSNLTINITLADNYELILSNADQVNDNVYTWVVNRNNFENKPINITYFDTDQANFTEPGQDLPGSEPGPEPEPEERQTPASTIIMVIIGLVGFVILLGVLIKIKQKRL